MGIGTTLSNIRWFTFLCSCLLVTGTFLECQQKCSLLTITCLHLNEGYSFLFFFFLLVAILVVSCIPSRKTNKLYSFLAHSKAQNVLTRP